MFNSDPLTVVILSLGVLVGWASASLAVYLFIVGGTRGTHPSPYRDDPQRPASR